MTEIRITIPQKTPEAEARDDTLELVLARCKLPRCQIAIPPTREYCCDAHRCERNNKRLTPVNAQRFEQYFLGFKG